MGMAVLTRAVSVKAEEAMERRIFERVDAQFPVRFVDLDEETRGVGQATDVNAKGLGFVSRQAVLPGTPLEMWLDIPDNHEALNVRGRVMWLQPQGYGQYRVGVKLNHADFMGLGRALRF